MSAYSDLVSGTTGLIFYNRLGGGASPITSQTGNNVAFTGATPSVAGALSGDADTALQFDGINDVGSTTIDLSALSTITVEFWLWWDVFANDDKLAIEFTASFFAVAGGFFVNPDESSTGTFNVAHTGSSGGHNAKSYTRPTAAAWHHYAARLDFTQAAASEILLCIDGVLKTHTGQIFSTDSPSGDKFANSTLNLMCRNQASLFGAGRLDELAIYNRALTADEIYNHYRVGVGRTLDRRLLLRAS